MRRALCAVVLLAACKPDLGSPPSLVLGPRIIAVFAIGAFAIAMVNSET